MEWMEDEWMGQNSEGCRLTELDVLQGCAEGTTHMGEHYLVLLSVL